MVSVCMAIPGIFQPIWEMREKTVRGKKITPGSIQLFTFVEAVSLFGKLQNFDSLGQQFAGLVGFSGTH